MDDQLTQAHTPAANTLIVAYVMKIITNALKANNKNGSGKSYHTKDENLVGQGHNVADEPITYCWTHSATKILCHTSKMCKRISEG